MKPTANPDIVIDIPMHFGKHYGKTPAELLQEEEGIRYLLWMRSKKHTEKSYLDEPNEEGVAELKTIKQDKPFITTMCEMTHFMLDAVVLGNANLKRSHKLHLDEEKFALILERLTLDGVNAELKEKAEKKERFDAYGDSWGEWS